MRSSRHGGRRAFLRRGQLRPIGSEHDLADLPIRGEIPPGLAGTLYRNGPNPQFVPPDAARHHWFLGDGMVHAFTLRDGLAAWRNRWVRTDKFLAERAGRALAIGFGGAREAGIPDTGLANTSLAWHGGKLLALEEAASTLGARPGDAGDAGRRFSAACRGASPHIRRRIRRPASWSSSAIPPPGR